MRFLVGWVFIALMLASGAAVAQECPQCKPIEDWLFVTNGGPCNYHGARLKSICDLDPECVQWNRACNAKRDELKACIARCLAGEQETPPQSQAPELDAFDRDMAAFDTGDFTIATGWAEPPEIIYKPGGRILIGGRRSGEWCRRVRKALAAQDPQRWAGGRIGEVIGLIGQVHVHRCGGPVLELKKGMYVLLGDRIVTGNTGRVRVRIYDAVEHITANANADLIYKRRPDSLINIAKNSEMNFDHFEDFQPHNRNVVDLVRGSVKIFFKGWSIGSSFSVKAGVSVCGIRGSEVIVRRESSDGSVQVGVIEGHAWLGNRVSREIRYLEAGQWAQDRTGGMTGVQAISRSDWDRVLLQDGLDLQGEAIDQIAPACGPIVGRWRWFTGSIVDFTADNRWQTTDGVNLGSWRCTVTDRGDDAVIVTPDAGGWEDVVVVDPGGAALRGQSRAGVDVSAVRIYP